VLKILISMMHYAQNVVDDSN